jgi:hypothetical protein
MNRPTTYRPKGPGDTWKTGQRVPWDGQWVDQYGIVTYFKAGHTFPPCIDRKGECAFRLLVDNAAATA